MVEFPLFVSEYTILGKPTMDYSILTVMRLIGIVNLTKSAPSWPPLLRPEASIPHPEAVSHESFPLR